MAESKQNESFFISEVITVELSRFTEYFNDLITTGSQRFRLERGELKIYAPITDGVVDDSFTALLRSGTPFFDAIIYLSLPGEKRSLIKNPNEANAEIVARMTYINVAKALYLIYFLLLTRGNVGDERMTTVSAGGRGSQIPAFLSKVMDFDNTIGYYRTILASFSLTKIPPDWVKFVRIAGLGTETRQRLTLQIAGHRLFKPFLYIEPLGVKAPQYRTQIAAIKEFINKGATWDVFTPTRSAELAQRLGPLNANLGNLMLEVYTEGQLNEMVENQLIAVLPRFKYGFANYKTYTTESFAPFTDYILTQRPIVRV
jgi:hypothetical protein